MKVAGASPMSLEVRVNRALVRTVRRSPWIALLLVAGCGGSGGGTEPDPVDNGPGNPPSAPTVKENPSFSDDIQPIFDNNGCSASSCHGVSEEAGLDLRAGNSYGELVGVEATSEPFQRVDPGDAENSYLVIKLEGRQSVGARMPETGSPLDSIALTNIRNWINRGAQQN